MNNKVSIIGAGAVGSTLAMRVVEGGLADVVLVDIFKNVAQGKSLDILDAAPLVGHRRHIHGTDNYEDIRDSNLVVVTAGFPRKPGMTREELVSKNAAVVREVAKNIKNHSPASIVIMVTNPLDAMTYLAYKETGLKREKVFGMAGALDGSRFISIISAELDVPRASIKTYILGSHGDTMVPLVSHTLVSGKPIEAILPKAKLEAIIKRTRERGAEIVSLLGTGSAYYSPSAAVFKMIEAILNDSREVLVASACLKGEYGLDDICIGVPCTLGKNGIEGIIELKLTKEEKEAFLKSARAIKDSIKSLSSEV